MSSAIHTHKEAANYAAEYSHEWPTTSVPRNPELYQPVPANHDKGWSHFIDSVKTRAIPWDVIQQTFESGEIHEAEGDNRYRFLWTCPGTLATFSLIVELRAEAFAYPDYKHYAVTVYRVET